MELIVRDQAKAVAMACLIAGDTYRETRAKITEQLNETVGLTTIWDWFHEDEEAVTTRNKQRLLMAQERDLDIVYQAQTILQDRMKDGSLYEVNAIKGTAQDKIHNALQRPVAVQAQNVLIVLNAKEPSE